MRISFHYQTWPQRLFRLALLVLLAAGIGWVAENAAEEFRVSCERRGGMHDCATVVSRWGRAVRSELSDGALLSASVVTRSDIDRDGTVTNYLYLALETNRGQIVSASQDDAKVAAAEITAFLADPTRRSVDIALSNRAIFRVMAAMTLIPLVYLLFIL